MRPLQRFGLLLLFVVALGAGAYVAAVAWPARYAARVLAFERDMKQGPGPNEQLAARLSQNDPAAARELLSIQQAFVDRVAAAARALRPAPPQYWQLQRDLERGTELLRLGHTNVVRAIDFQERARVLHALVRVGLTAQQRPLTVGAVLATIDQQRPKLIAAGEALFAGEPVPLNNPTYEEMRSAWEDARRGLDVLVSALRREQPARLFADAVRRPQTGPEADAERALERFAAILRTVAERPIAPSGAVNLLAASPNAQEFQEITARVTPAFEALKRRYSQDVGDR